MSNDANTVYTLHGKDSASTTTDTDLAEDWSRNGGRVSAVTAGGDDG